MHLRLRTVIGALSLALSFGAAGPARAATATLTATTAPEGYTRLQFSFDRAPEAQAKLANGVLVVTFSEPVTFENQRLGGGLGALIGAVRLDPDGTAVRMALNGQAKIVPTAAGERFIVDLLPPGWSGLPPPLPNDLIAELTRQVRADKAARAEEDRSRTKPQATLTVEGATHPTFRRLVFRLGGEPPVDWKRSGPTVAVTIDAPYQFDAAGARARLPLEFAGISSRRTEKGLVVTVPSPGNGTIRGFREDGDFVLDIDREGEAAGARPAATADQHAHAPEPVAPAPSAAVEQHAPAEKRAEAPVSPIPAKPAEKPAPMREAAPAPAAAPAAPAVAQATEPPSLRRVGRTTRIVFPFARQVPAAVFMRGKTLWLAFDDAAPLRLDGIVAQSAGAILSVEPVAVDRGQAVRLRLAEPMLVSAAVEGDDWAISLGDDVASRSGVVEFAPATDRSGRLAIQAELPGLGSVRTIRDPEIGDRIAVVTLTGPSRGLPALRQFVEFAALPSVQGLALSLAAEDVEVAASIERISIERPGGLTLSPTVSAASEGPAQSEAAGDLVLGAADWAAENAAPFARRETELMLGAALSSVEDRPAARLALAKFYQARGRAADSAAVLGAIVEDAGLSERDPRIGILRAAAAVELRRPESALAILSVPSLRMKPEAALWRAAAEEAVGRLDNARAALKDGEGAIAALPAELKARFTALGLRLALESGDAHRAETLYSDLEILPATEGVAAREILKARLDELAGDKAKAAAVYEAVARRGDPASAAEAELRAVSLGLETKTLAEPEAIVRLERLVTGWRGDRIEADALARLIDLYAAASRWRDAFSTLRVAVEAFPDGEETRALQDRMQARFAELFLADGLDRMPKLDALALFYDFKELLPGGRRGDELVRALADKLVDVDLLDQAADLLNYQIDNRLTGAARAQVASRAALVELMNGKAGKAVELLRKTRQADLPSSLIKARTRIEARALAETGRVDLALEIAEGLEGQEARRLRADILWSARRWPEAGEALEAALGSAWRGAAPLSGAQRSDAMRAAIASALAGDSLAVDRIRQKYAPKMADSPEAAAFEIVTAPIEARGDAFREVARSVAATSSFRAFLEEYRRAGAQPAAGQPAAAPDKA